MEEPKSYSIEKLSESNYRSWSQVVESHLDDQDLWEVVKGDMEKHLQKIERLKRQIEEQGELISGSSYVSVLLNCAPSRYDVQISILEAQDDVTSTIIINRLLEEYRKFLTAEPEKTLMAMLTNQGKGVHKGQKSKKKFDGKCNQCNKQGHKEDQCWIKHPELKPEKG